MTELPNIDRTLDAMAAKLREHLARKPVLVGIYSGGVWVAQRLHERLGLEEPLGTLDISFYRDDFTRLGLHPQVKASHLPVNIEDRHVILVDDVLHTGRTIRAALNEIFDYGRPASVLLAALIERDGRELPIQADVVGARVALARNQHIKLSGPDPLELKLQEVGG